MSFREKEEGMYVSRGMYIFTRKMRKKIISILLGCVMAMSLVACGDSDDGNSKDSSNDNQAESTERDEVNESQEDNKPIKVVDMKIEYVKYADDNDGSKTVITYEYNDYYDVISDSDGTLYEYEYDSMGNCIYKTTYHDSGFKEEEYNEYDSMGNCINKKIYYDGDLEWDEYNTYDSFGNIISQELLKYYDDGDSSTYYYEYEYDGNNNLIKMTRTQPSLAWVEYVYDSDNKLILEKEYDDTFEYEMSAYYEYEYENKSLLKKTRYTRDEEGNYFSVEVIEYEYDVDGFLVKEMVQGAGYSREIEYKYKKVE